MRTARVGGRTGLTVLTVALLTGLLWGQAEIPVDAAFQPAQDEFVPPAQDEFIPMESIPPEDQLPAAPLLVAAYALLWVAVIGYLWSIWRRMATVERELLDLSRRTGGS